MSLAASLRAGGNRGTPPGTGSACPGTPGAGGRRCPALRGWKRSPKFPVNPFGAVLRPREGGHGGGWRGDPELGEGVPGVGGGLPLAAAEATREPSQLPTPSPAHPSPGKWALLLLQNALFKAKFASWGPRLGWLGVLMGLEGSRTPFPGVPRSSPSPWGESRSPPR